MLFRSDSCRANVEIYIAPYWGHIYGGIFQESAVITRKTQQIEQIWSHILVLLPSLSPFEWLRALFKPHEHSKSFNLQWHDNYPCALRQKPSIVLKAWFFFIDLIVFAITAYIIVQYIFSNTSVLLLRVQNKLLPCANYAYYVMLGQRFSIWACSLSSRSFQ